MEHKLTLILRSKVIDGVSMDGPGDPVQYSVSGLPPGEEAEIALSPPDTSKWSILRIIEGKQGEWSGAYETAEDARTALEIEVNQG